MPDTDGVSSASRSRDVTVLLRRWSDGDAAALDALLPAVHDELRRLARSYMRRERGEHTLEPTALVNEAYLRLVDQRDVRWASRGHFFAIAAQAMRRVLVDHARGHVAAKRGGGAGRVAVSGVEAVAPDAPAIDVLWLHEALEALTTLDAPGAHRRTALLRGHVGGGGRRGAADLAGDRQAGVRHCAGVARAPPAQWVRSSGDPPALTVLR